jgi:hypothetical protein
LDSADTIWSPEDLSHIRRGYLLGRFGALPILSDSDDNPKEGNEHAED